MYYVELFIVINIFYVLLLICIGFKGIVKNGNMSLLQSVSYKTSDKESRIIHASFSILFSSQDMYLFPGKLRSFLLGGVFDFF